MLKYIIGAILGGGVGYFVFYKIIGCANGGCAITANPYTATVYGVILGLLVAGMITLPQKSGSDESAQYKKLSAAAAQERIQSGDALIILDVRTKAEFDAGHIPGALLLPNEEIGGAKPDLLPDFDAEILIYCRSGNRSAQAARKLLALGYTDVYDFGGIIDSPYETVVPD